MKPKLQTPSPNPYPSSSLGENLSLGIISGVSGEYKCVRFVNLLDRAITKVYQSFIQLTLAATVS